MGTSGVPFNPNRDALIACIKKRKGVVSHITKDMDCHHGTLHKYINNDPELKQILDEARHEYDDLICDFSENTLLHAVSQREDLPSAIRGAQFVLNNKGKKRGYIAPHAPQEAESYPNDKLIDIQHQMLKKDAEIKELKEKLNALLSKTS